MTTQIDKVLPLYEGKMGNIFDHRSAYFVGIGVPPLPTDRFCVDTLPPKTTVRYCLDPKLIPVPKELPDA